MVRIKNSYQQGYPQPVDNLLYLRLINITLLIIAKQWLLFKKLSTKNIKKINKRVILDINPLKIYNLIVNLVS